MGNTRHIIVTGGAGFIGSHIASRLIKEGYKVTILDNLSTGKGKNIPRGADFINMDLGQKSAYVGIEKLNCHAVFHLAGQSSGEASFDKPLYDMQSHVMSTFFILEWCKRNNVSRFIYASSMSVYGDPDYIPIDEKHPFKPKTFYAAGKISAESYTRLYQTLGINTTIFRLFSVYGPGQDLENLKQGMVSIYLSYMLKGIPIVVKGAKDRFRDFLYIDDAVDASIKSLYSNVTYGKVYNLASGKKTTVEDLLRQLKDSYGNQNYPIEYKDSTPGDQFGVVSDIRRITQELRWKPRVGLREGLDKVVSFERKGVKIG